jgi:hypothetical protein
MSILLKKYLVSMFRIETIKKRMLQNVENIKNIEIN